MGAWPEGLYTTQERKLTDSLVTHTRLLLTS